MIKRCPICEHKLLPSTPDVEVCESCGLGLTTKTPSQNYKHYHRDSQYFENESLFRDIFLKRLQIIEKFKKTGKVLEIGSSTGVMLELFQKKGWEVMGIEPSKKACEIANKRGIKTLNTNFESAALNNIYDVVILNHVLEHLDNPKLILKKCFQVLSKGGLVFIDIPNFGSLASRLWKSKWKYRLLDEHNWHFTHKSLSKLLRITGFVEIHWEARSGIFDWGRLSLRRNLLFGLLTLIPDLIITKLKLGTSLTVIGHKA